MGHFHYRCIDSYDWLEYGRTSENSRVKHMTCCIRIYSALVMVYDLWWSDASALVILYDMLLSHHNKSAKYRYRPRQRIVNVHDS
jgi:hypothetical protein